MQGFYHLLEHLPHLLLARFGHLGFQRQPALEDFAHA
jgi:hypothetical protein